MAEIRDNFIKSLDDSQCGITYKMEKVYSTLKEKDVELYLKLVRTWTFVSLLLGMWSEVVGLQAASRQSLLADFEIVTVLNKEKLNKNLQ